MQWFKFYGAEYISDPKMLALSPAERSCWITLLSLACVAEDNGRVRYLTEERLKTMAGLSVTHEEWDETNGVLDKFVALRMIVTGSNAGVPTSEYNDITIKNWGKRQNTLLTGAERQKRHRDKLKSNAGVTEKSHDSNARVEESREEKNRERGDSSISFLQKVPDTELQALSQKYRVSKAGIQSKAHDLRLYCISKGKKYKNYKAFLENALRKDAPKLRTEYPLPRPAQKVDNEKPLTPDQWETLKKEKGNLVKKLSTTTPLQTP